MSQSDWKRPEFAQKIIEKYLSSQSNTFLVYGNTRDIYPVSEDRYVGLVDFFIEALIKPDREESPKLVLIYDPVLGVTFRNPLDKQLVAKEIGAERLENALTGARQDVVTACSVLRELTRLNISVQAAGNIERVRKDFAVIIKYGEVVAPGSSGDIMLDSDRLKVITLENWISDTTFVASSDIVFIISETLNGINSRIVDLPYCSTIPIDRPKQPERRQFINNLIQKEEVEASVPVERLAYSTAGLTLLSIRQIFRQAAYKGASITAEMFFEKTKEIIEKELEGHIEFPFLTYGFEKVIGASRLLKKLGELKTCIQGSDPDLMPTGILVPGANGVGKTFIYKAFAKESGWVAVVLKNIRGPYVGQTEKNWERIRSVLEAMSNVMILYDEADTEIGGRSAQTHEVDRRLFGAILRMMSEPANRGRIIWIIITARPDKLEPDIKRSGRAGEHLPVFADEGEEKIAFITHVLKQAGVNFEEFPAERKTEFMALTADYFPADFDQLVTELRRRRLIDGGLTTESIIEEIRDFIPSDIARQREYQELLAVLECTSRELLPARYANLSKEQIQDRLRIIRELMVGM
jgi:hypothetical protein